MKTGQIILSFFLATCCLSLGCDTPPAMMMPDAGPIPSATPSPSPEPTMPPKAGNPPDAEVVPHCEMKTLDPELLVEKPGSGETITDIRVAANDKGFAISWRNNKSTLPTMFRSFDWNNNPTSDVVHIGNMYLNWNNGLIGGTDDYMATDSRFQSGTEIPPQPFKYSFRRVSASGELVGAYSAGLQLSDRDMAPHIMFDGKYYRVTTMMKHPVGCATFLISYQMGVSGALVHDASKCVFLGDDPVNGSIQSVLPMEDDVLVAYNHHIAGAAELGSIKIVGLKGPTDWEPATAPSFTLLEGVYNTSDGMKMLWLKSGERFISSLTDGKIVKSYTLEDQMMMGQTDGSSLYGLRFNQLDNRTEFLRADMKGNTMSKIDIKSPITDPSYAMANRGGKFIIANFAWWGSKKPELRTISCQ